jgi:predicted DNA-binding protein (MmcQ/YjbR family)
MDVDSIRAYGLSFPHVTEKLQWGDDLCFKIGGKIFAMLGLDLPRLCFKCTLDVFAELIEREDIRPAPYVGRYKWVILDRLDAVRDAELEDLIRQSYEMVAAKAPKLPKGGRSPQPPKRSRPKCTSEARPAHRSASRDKLRFPRSRPLWQTCPSRGKLESFRLHRGRRNQIRVRRRYQP